MEDMTSYFTLRFFMTVVSESAFVHFVRIDGENHLVVFKHETS